MAVPWPLSRSDEQDAVSPCISVEREREWAGTEREGGESEGVE